MKIVALAGGTGAAKFLRGLCRVADPADVTVIGNTGDDLEMWGLAVSPDLDTVMYTLAGLVDEAKGWGVRDDTFACRDAMGRLGATTFFGLGDRDLATHLLRTEQLRAGVSLTEVTDALRLRLGMKSRLLPMSNEPVRTRVRTPSGWLSFQEFFVRDRCAPEIADLDYEGAERARPAPGVLESIAAARVVVLCPSNPISSVGPILAVPGIRRALAATTARVVAVSPIVGTAPVSGPAGKMMAAKGFAVSPLGVAAVYAEILDQLVVDTSDAALVPALESTGLKALVTASIMDSAEKEKALARAVLEGGLMTIAVVPVKDLERAKQRLSARLGVSERRALVLLMLEDVLQTLRRIPGVTGILVVTRAGEAAERAARLGAEVLEEPTNDGYTSAIERAAQELTRRGAPAMLSLPGDVPGVSCDEIEQLLAARATAPSVVLVPSRDGRGTNAALVSPPGAFHLRFGEPSFAAHVARARETGLATEVLHLSGLALDLDSPDDLDTFLRQPSTTATYYFLQEALAGRPRTPMAPPRSEHTR